jgi:hypothetical protein
MNKFFIALLSLLVTLPIYAADGFSSVEEQMTGREFSAAGLDKLSQSELDVLNAWIRSRSLATLDPPNGSAAPVVAEKEEEKPEVKPDDEDEDSGKERTTITSNLDGEFSGWDGQTTFELKNGQVWVQADKDKFYTKEISNPVVIIEPGMFGSWRLQIEGFDEECKVKRIQ